MSSDNRTGPHRKSLPKLGLAIAACALAAFAIVYVAVGIANPGSRAQNDMLKTVNGVAVVMSAPKPAEVLAQPLLDYGEQPGGKAK